MMPPCRTTLPRASISHTQFCVWLITIRRPVPDRRGTGRTSHRLAVEAIRRAYVVLASEPVWLKTLADWNRTVAAWVIAPALPSTGPAVQPRLFRRVCAAFTWETVIASAGTVVPSATSVIAAVARPSFGRIRIPFTPLVVGAKSRSLLLFLWDVRRPRKVEPEHRTVPVTFMASS